MIAPKSMTERIMACASGLPEEELTVTHLTVKIGHMVVADRRNCLPATRWAALGEAAEIVKELASLATEQSQPSTDRRLARAGAL